MRVGYARPEKRPENDGDGGRADHRERRSAQHVLFASVAELVSDDEPHLRRWCLLEQRVGDDDPSLRVFLCIGGWLGVVGDAVSEVDA